MRQITCWINQGLDWILSNGNHKETKDIAKALNLSIKKACKCRQTNPKLRTFPTTRVFSFHNHHFQSEMSVSLAVKEAQGAYR